MLDLVRIYLKAGDGGNGKVAFFRNRSVLKGGPEGGNGGDGGNIVIEADDKLNTLQHFSGVKKILAGDGQMGGRAKQIGRKGQEEIIKVPLGTVVCLYSENQASWLRRNKYGLKKTLTREDVELERYFVEKETQAPPLRKKDEVDESARPKFEDFLHKTQEDGESEFAPLVEDKLTKIAVLKQNGEKLVLCQGGFGGKGNDAFKSPSKTTPMEAEYGTFGEQKMIFLELQLLANVGLVGLPNAGKSTLLSRLTKARPKIANYPFTTIEPNLGVMTLSGERSLVLADIPGLIEGAHEGKGLGYSFLRHVQNCKEIVYVVSLNEDEAFAENITNAQKAEILYQQYLLILNEIKDYREEILKKNAIIAINKSDLYMEDLKECLQESFRNKGLKTIFVSGVTGAGMEELKELIWKFV